MKGGRERGGEGAAGREERDEIEQKEEVEDNKEERQWRRSSNKEPCKKEDFPLRQFDLERDDIVSQTFPESAGPVSDNGNLSKLKGNRF
jgi:hypothetical protein